MSANMAEQRLIDAVEREQALDPDKSFIVQAPAGSGKTALLTRRFLRLLARVEAPEQVLAITFTRKAADEMRARVLGALRASADQTVADNPFMAAMLGDAGEVLRRDRREDWGLLQTPARLQIMTVDALNTRMVAARPVSSGYMGRSLVSPDTRESLLAAAADATLDWLGESGDTGDAIRYAYASVDFDSAAWRRQIVSMLKRRDKWLPIVVGSLQRDADELRAASENLLETLVRTALANVSQRLTDELAHSMWQSLRVAHRNLAGQSPQSAFPVAPSDGENDVRYWRFAAKVLLVSDKAQWRKRVDRRQGFVPTDKVAKKDVGQLLERLSNVEGLAAALDACRHLPEPQYSQAQWLGVTATMTALRLASAEFTRLLNDAGYFDYPELAASALDTLGDDDTVGDLALQYDYRLQHLLVDEMQDTSARQYRLLERLTAGWQADDGRTLFCVGDPMQSIYRFRGAEVSLFLRAWEQGIGSVPLVPIRLSTNFRSTVPLVDWVNDTFRTVFGGTNNAVDEAVAHVPSAAAPSAESDGDVIWHCNEVSAAG